MEAEAEPGLAEVQDAVGVEYIVMAQSFILAGVEEAE